MRSSPDHPPGARSGPPAPSPEALAPDWRDTRGALLRGSRLAIVPVLAVIVGGSIAAVAALQERRMVAAYRRSFEDHAATVTRLARAGVEQATLSVGLLYESAEGGLADSAKLLARLDGHMPGAGDLEGQAIVVWVAAQRGPFEGRWGPIRPEERERLVAEVLSASEGTLVDDGLARDHGLYCVHVEGVGAAARHIACREAAKLDRLRRETGLRPLLAAAAGPSVLHLALQDEGGVLASSPGAGPLSSWRHDPLLALARASETPIFRHQPDARPPRIEGLSAFPLPDGSTAVLRVAVDATALARIEAVSRAHARSLLLAVAALLGVSITLAVLIGRWEQQQRRSAHQLALHEAENRQWQALGQMAAVVAHEVRNPLNALQMAAQRLAREFAVPEPEREEHAELVRLLRSQAERVNRVVTEFLELGKPIRLEPVMATVPSVLEEALLPARLRARREGKQLAIDVADAGEAWIDPQRVAQIVANLAGNALDAIPAGGHVTVRGVCDAGHLLISVHDDGEGMDADTLRRVQEPFVTTRANGTGLGLPIARRLAEAHGGTLSIASALGSGARAEVRLPRRPPERARD